VIYISSDTFVFHSSLKSIKREEDSYLPAEEEEVEAAAAGRRKMRKE
jgi:hypothetical protein